uniref:Uncharacterized protein n=1 Tax=Anopheles atroparvus TaxID=41427 RepID=A0A182ITB1_ANOAO
MPPITPYVSISIVTEVLRVLRANAALEMILPAIQTARHPYLFASADTTGPALRYIPLSKLPTHATVPLPSPKYTTNSFRNTPNVYAIPSTIMLHMKEANTITQPYLKTPQGVRELIDTVAAVSAATAVVDIGQIDRDNATDPVWSDDTRLGYTVPTYPGA